jgi:hypothetical protein
VDLASIVQHWKLQSTPRYTRAGFWAVLILARDSILFFPRRAAGVSPLFGGSCIDRSTLETPIDAAIHARWLLGGVHHRSGFNPFFPQASGGRQPNTAYFRLF